MTAFSSDRPRSKLPLFIAFLVLLVLGLVAAGWYLSPRFESEAPQVALSTDAEVFGAAPFEITVTDKGTGLKSVVVTLSQGGTEHSLANEQFAQPAAEKKARPCCACAPRTPPCAARSTATRPSSRRTSRST